MRSWTSRAETKLNYEFKVVLRKLLLLLFFNCQFSLLLLLVLLLLELLLLLVLLLLDQSCLYQENLVTGVSDSLPGLFWLFFGL